MVDSIPGELARKLTNMNYKFEVPTDKLEDGTYVPLSNIRIKEIISYAEGLEKKHSRAAMAAQMVTPLPQPRKTFPLLDAMNQHCSHATVNLDAPLMSID